jgi:hypothetical protein
LIAWIHGLPWAVVIIRPIQKLVGVRIEVLWQTLTLIELILVDYLRFEIIYEVMDRRLHNLIRVHFILRNLPLTTWSIIFLHTRHNLILLVWVINLSA